MQRKKYRRPGRRRRRTGRLALALACMVLLIAAGVLAAGWLQSRLRREPPLVVDYQPIVLRYAGEYRLEPAYIAAVIMAESSYRADAVSSADARGLMQILPSTAEWISGKLGERNAEPDLFDPETNIRYGAWYLRFLMDRYVDDMRCATAAYHAGQGTVDAWLRNPDYSKDGRELEVIAYASTNTYVNRVLRFYERYLPVYQKLQAE